MFAKHRIITYISNIYLLEYELEEAFKNHVLN